MDGSKFPTWDAARRARRFEELLVAAEAAVLAGRKIGRTVLVTGSTARGEVHPWSDLDLLMLGDTDHDASYAILRACEGVGVSDVTVLTPGEVVGPLHAGLVGGAVPLTDVPRILAPLPPPKQAIDRAAFKIVQSCERLRELLEHKEPIGPYSAAQVGIGSAALWSHVPLKRLAVFADGGRSAWLDDEWDTDALMEMATRLERFSDEPFHRPAVFPPDARRFVPLLARYDGRCGADEAKAATAWFLSWGALLDLVSRNGVDPCDAPEPDNAMPHLAR